MRRPFIAALVGIGSWTGLAAADGPPGVPPAPPRRTSEAAARTTQTPKRPADEAGTATTGWARRGAIELGRRARARHDRGDLMGAVGGWTEAVRMDPTYGDAYLALGALRERLGDPAEAERVYTAALRVRSVAAEALARRALVRRRRGRVVEALRDLELAVSKNPRSLDHARTLASWYAQQRAWPAALAVWRRVAARIDANEDREVAREARIQIAALGALAGSTDPVVRGGADHPSWVRRSLASAARRGR